MAPPTTAARMHFSLRVLIAANMVALLLAIALLGVGIWMTQRVYDRCSSRLQWLVIAVALIMLLVSSIGLLGARRRSPGLLWVYLVLLTVVMVLLLVLTIFSFMLKAHGFGTLINSQLVNGGGYAVDDTFSPLVRKDQCQVRFLQAFRNDWGKVAIASLVILIILGLVYAAACISFMHAMNRRVFSRPYY